MTTAHSLTLHWLPGTYAVCRLAADAPVPAWAKIDAACGSSPRPNAQGPRPAASPTLLSITRTDAELSIVVDEAGVPGDVNAERGFVAMRIVGQLDFGMIGLLALLTGTLRDAGVPVLAISTFDTDILLVREADQAKATEALQRVANIE